LNLDVLVVETLQKGLDDLVLLLGKVAECSSDRLANRPLRILERFDEGLDRPRWSASATA
jgi:hypothetical protein